MSSKATIPVLADTRSGSFGVVGTFDFPHGSIFVNGKIFLSAQMTPGRVIRIDPDNFATYDIAVFPNPLSRQIRGLDMAYDSVVNNLIYVLHRTNSGTTISTVDPTTMATNLPIEVLDLTYINLNGALAINSTHLFCGTATGTPGSPAADDAFILKFALTDYSYTALTLPDLKQCHALEFDGTYIYATGLVSTSGNAWVAKIDPATLAYTSAYFPAGSGLPTDDFAMFGNYLYVGTELVNANKIYRISKTDLSITEISVIGLTNANFYGLFSSGTHVWAGIEFQFNIPADNRARLIRLDPTTLEQRLYTFSTGEVSDAVNEILFNGPYMYAATFQNGSKIFRFNIPTT